MTDQIEPYEKTLKRREREAARQAQRARREIIGHRVELDEQGRVVSRRALV